jgi:hypothetical protein
MFASVKEHRKVIKMLQQMTQCIHTTGNRLLMRWQSQAIKTKVSSRGEKQIASKDRSSININSNSCT